MESIEVNFEEKEKLYAGFLNPEKLGVCLTNTLLALILSSPTLMNEVKVNIRKEKCDLFQYVKDVTGDPLLKNPVQRNFSSGDFLRQSLVDAQEGIPSQSVHGMTGLYMLIRNHDKMRKSNSLSRNLFCPPGTSKEDLCTVIIREDRPSGPAYHRWLNLLNDVLDNKNEEIESYRSKNDWMFSWRASIKLLNTQIELNKLNDVPFWKHVHLPRDPFELLSEDSFGKFKRIYAKDIKVNPRYLLLHLESTSHAEIHPTTYRSIAFKLHQLSASGHAQRLIKENLDGVLIGVEERSVKWPRFNVDEDMTDFSLESMKNHKYSIRGISVYMMDFTRFPFWKVTLNIKDIPRPTINGNYQCAFTSYNFMLSYIRELWGDGDLIHFINKNSIVIMSVLEDICMFIGMKNDGLVKGGNSNCHFYSVIRSNQDNWFLMNDEFVIPINDINEEKFSFKYELISSVLYEIIEETI